MSGSSRQQLSPNFHHLSPTERPFQNHYNTAAIQNGQNQQSYSPVTNGHSSRLPPPPPPAAAVASRSSYYDPVDRSGDVNAGYSRRDRTSSIHSQSGTSQRYSYGGEAAVGGSPRSPVDHGSRGSYPLQSPASANHRRGSSAFSQDARPVEPTAMPSEYGATRPHHEPISPTKSTPGQRGGAMSISALLSTGEAEPTSNNSSKPRNVPSKRQPSDHASSRSPELLRSTGRQNTYRPPHSLVHPRDADTTDSDHERLSLHTSGKQAATRDVQHRAYDSEDLEQSDSEADSDEFEAERIEYMSILAKRKLDIAQQETERRKRRRLVLQDRLHDNLDAYGKTARERARKKFHDDAMGKVLKREEEDEKERKKEQQRKRRREKAEADKRVKAELQAKAVVDVAARQQSERRAREDLLTMKPQSYERPMHFDEMSVDLTADGPESDFSVLPFDEPKKQRKKPGPKPKKLKELAMAEEPELIAAEPVREDIVPHASKSYNALFDQIWRDIARKEIPKLYRTQQTSLATKQSNLRKTAQLASKEAQRWKLRTTKNIKDTQARAKRCMREMLTFWKRNEREERDSRRRAEKEAIERAKKEEEMREAKRQARKLNFLISQTELYSHFIGRKIKTDEVERSTDTDGVAATTDTIQGPEKGPGKPAMLDDDSKAETTGTVTWDDIADEDDEAVERAARNNAQNAIQAAQDRARKFNEEAGTGEKTEMSNINLDDGDMNFQNPTSLGDIDIQQPKMLNCQLKEYQLKGLNWLCNLYEQGINGILADEMGLGKTVQSISVMAYLAEYHNIWGPFLVIAPASTLHNWQQEITRFVPKLKALPYWGSAKDRKVLRKFWDRKQLTYNEDSPFHVLITSYQLVVQDTQYFQRMKWQYMILDEAQAIKSSSSSRWKALLGFHCRNRLLLTGTPIQNSMQELWALLHFIMPSLFDSHDEFSEWFSKDIESHAQSNTQLNESQLRRLHMILKPFMLRRVKKHVQKELGDKIEEDVFCNLTYRQRAIYRGLRDKISIMDLIEKAASGGEENTATLMNLVMQFRKVCNHPDLFERADTRSPLSFTMWAETQSFLREGPKVDVAYTVRNLINYRLPSFIYRGEGRLDLPGEDTDVGSKQHILRNLCNIWRSDHIKSSVSQQGNTAFSWLRFVDTSPSEASAAFHQPLAERAIASRQRSLGRFHAVYDEDGRSWTPAHAMLVLSEIEGRNTVAETTVEGRMAELLNVATRSYHEQRLHNLEPLAYPSASAPPVGLICLNQNAVIEQENIMFNERARQILYGPSPAQELTLVENKVELNRYPVPKMLPEPSLERAGYAKIQVPSMSRFVSDSGKLAKLDQLLTKLKAGGHRVLLYFQMTRMMDLCEEYLTYRHHRYLRLDGSSKLEDRRDMVAAWQTTPEIFVFILSTRAGGLGINLTAADTVIFYDSDWNPTIDSQAMDRAHRLGQTKQVRVYRLITRGTIEERIRMRAQQKEEVQRVVIQGGDPGAKKTNVDFKGTREVATWLFDNEEAAELEKTLEAKEKEAEEAKAKGGKRGKKRKVGAAGIDGASGAGGKAFNIEDMYHEGEGRFDDSGKPSEAGTPAAIPATGSKKRGPKPKGNKKKTTQQRLDMIDGVSGDRDVDMGEV